MPSKKRTTARKRVLRGGAALTAIATAVGVGAALNPADATGSRASGSVKAHGTAPLTGSAAARKTAPTHQTVTRITGDKVDVTTDAAGHTTAALEPTGHGSVPLSFTEQVNGDLYVFPQKASAALAAGSVDQSLFDITSLIAQGYGDESAAATPVIAVYKDQNSADASPPARTRAAGTKSLKSIHGVAFAAPKETSADTWSTLVDAHGKPRSGLTKVWLDQKVHTTLQSEDKQIGAAAAWSAGLDGKGVKVAVLDTGIDAAHPDLVGQVLDAQNFTDPSGVPDADVHDAVGHGTFVASEVAGTGAASGGAQRGVADGAKLLVGKVLDDSGSGTDSQIIAGMQWASDSGADVASMSLGSPVPTDCTDPMSVAAENLARTSRTLFVVAAGNIGQYESVSSPGCAPDVLTVGAVDSADKTATFSSRGSVMGVHTLKPEIAAPGVDVVGANDGGRGVYAYTSMSGTSMATPLVAGSAALIKQEHPDWTGAQLKVALVSSASTAIPGDVQQTGGGRLSVSSAIRQTVLGSAAVEFGTFAWPQVKSDARTLQVPYTNTGGAPVTLALAVQSVTGDDDSTVAAASIVKLGATTVTVAAGATVQVPLTFTPTARLNPAQYGDVAGRVVATSSDGTRISTPFNAYVQPRTISVRVKVIDRDGNLVTTPGDADVELVDMSEATGSRQSTNANGEIDYQLRPGTFFLNAFVTTADPRDTTGTAAPLSVTALSMPEFSLTKDTVITLDARKASHVEVKGDKPLQAQTSALELGRTWGGKWVASMGAITGGPLGSELYQWGSGAAKTGTFESGAYFRMAAPQLTITGGATLQPRYPGYAEQSHFTAIGSAQVVTAKSGLPADLAAAGVAGRIALIPDDGTDVDTVATNARAAGAVGVLVYQATPGTFSPNDLSQAEPVLEITLDEARALTSKIAKGPVTLAWTSTPDSPYVYNLAFHDTGHVAASHVHRVTDASLAKVTENWSSLGVADHMMDTEIVLRPWNPLGGVDLGSMLVATPSTRTAYYQADDSTWQHLAQSRWPFAEFMTDVNRTYTAGGVRSEDWYRGVIRPVVGLDPTGRQTLQGERQGAAIGVDFTQNLWGDGNPDHYATESGFGDVTAVDLVAADGTDLGASFFGPANVWTVPSADASYTLKLAQQRNYHTDVWRRSGTVETDFTFRSHQDDNAYSQSLPLLYPSYGAALDPGNDVVAGPQQITLSATGQKGYTPGALTSATLSYSYDGGTTWTAAAVAQVNGVWTASVDHTGQSGKTVTLKTTLGSADGASVTQTVTDAYGVK